MRADWILTVGFLLISFGLPSCKKQAPQIPSNKIVIDNSDTQALLTINQDLAKKEDSILKLSVKKRDGKFIKNDLGFWYKIEQAGKGEKIIDKSTCSYTYQLSLLNGEFIQKGNKQILIGKKQIVYGLEEGLKLLNQGDSAVFIIPWYLAYGMNGNKPEIEPYTSLVYNIRVKNKR